MIGSEGRLTQADCERLAVERGAAEWLGIVEGASDGELGTLRKEPYGKHTAGHGEGGVRALTIRRGRRPRWPLERRRQP